jgi:hypothetical protein
MNRIITLALTVALFAGCNGDQPYDLVKVSGQIFLDGQPLPEARVMFRPVPEAAQSRVGPDAYGKTDAHGNFILTTIFDEKGATVGRNLVSITTLEVQEDPLDPDNGRARRVINPEKVPPNYNSRSELYFEVHQGSEQNATFHLQSR